ncbi:MAG TPA: GspH/FimT family pseudopilin [Candidatus Tectomicrobia bacterium]|nr:GspH/FimT family pseudopilin [Candidatus Tectomicrobia bacterium]
MGRRAALTRRAGRRAAPGFTLLELLVTLAVVAIAVGLALPVIGRSTETIRARAEVAAFSALLRHARERAITSREPHAVVIEPAEQRVVLRAGGPEGDIREVRQLSPRLTIEAVPPPALTVRFEPQGASSGGDFRVASGPVVYRVTVDPVTGRVRNQRQ